MDGAEGVLLSRCSSIPTISEMYESYYIFMVLDRPQGRIRCNRAHLVRELPRWLYFDILGRPARDPSIKRT